MTDLLSSNEKDRYATVNKENLDFLMNRYNRVNRWVIGDMIRRSRYHYPDKVALVYNDRTFTYSELEDALYNLVQDVLDDMPTVETLSGPMMWRVRHRRMGALKNSTPGINPIRQLSRMCCCVSKILAR